MKISKMMARAIQAVETFERAMAAGWTIPVPTQDRYHAAIELLDAAGA